MCCLSYGKPQEVRAYCRKIIDGVAADGGYIMDAGAIMQNDTSIENLHAMTDAVHEFGGYSSSLAVFHQSASGADTGLGGGAAGPCGNALPTRPADRSQPLLPVGG